MNYGTGITDRLDLRSNGASPRRYQARPDSNQPAVRANRHSFPAVSGMDVLPAVDVQHRTLAIVDAFRHADINEKEQASPLGYLACLA